MLDKLRRFDIWFPIAWLGLGIFLLFWEVLILDYIAIPADLPFERDPVFLAVKPPDFTQANNLILDDHFYQFYSWQRVAARAIRQTGRLPLWNPYVFAGQPLLANAQSALFYPPNLMLYFFSAETISALRIFFNIFFAGVWVYLLGRVLGASRNGATLSAVAFAFSGVVMVGPWHAYVSSLIWLPMALWAGEKSLVSRRPFFWGLWAALGIGLGILGGHPETSFYNMVIFCAYFALRLLTMPGAISEKTRRAPPLFLALGLGLMIGAVQWLPFAAFLERSAIGTRNLFQPGSPFYYYRDWQLQLLTLASLWMPNIFGNPVDHNYFWPSRSFMNYLEQAIYFGLIPLALAISAAFGLSRKNKIVAILAVMALLCLLISMRFPGFETVSHLPVFNKVNITRLKWDFTMFAAVLAGFGLDGLREYFISGRSANRRLVLVAAIIMAPAVFIWIIGLAIELALPYLSPLPTEGFAFHWFSEILSFEQPRSLVTLLVPLAAPLLFLLARYRSHWLPALEIGLIAVVFVELIVQARGYNTVLPRSYVTLDHRLVRLLQKDPDLFRIATAWPIFWANIGPMYGLQDLAGLNLPVDRNFAAVYQAQGGGRSYIQDWKPDMPLLDYLNARYVITGRKQRDPKYELIIARENDGYYVYRNRQAFPRAYLVRNFRVMEEDPPALEAMIRGAKDPSVIDLSEEVVLHESLGDDQARALKEAATQGGELPAVKTSLYENDRLVLETVADTAALLVMSDVYDPGWQVTIDDRPTDLYRANVAFRAVFVPAGEHTITFTYRPVEFRLGAALSLIGLGLFFLGLVLSFLGRRRGQSNSLEGKGT
jgi:hypothetical protein